APEAAAANPTAHVTVTHGPAVQNGGVGLHLVQPGGQPQADHGTSNAATSTNWSGYAATGSTYKSVSASWVQPKATCKSGSQYAAFWVGLDGDGSNSVEQDGTDSDCSGGSPKYYGWYEMYPSASHTFGKTVKPGDTISASVTFEGSGSFKLVLSDKTAGWSSSTTKSLSSAKRSSAEVIIEAPASGLTGSVLPLADFGTVHFSNSKVNGAAIGNTSPTQIDMVNSSGAKKDTVSSLSGGESFSATWDRSK
ncbi:MAG: hypothetical protein J2P25_22860, partial [Nocardiopsaceae bacterium]|nr:hypothetical protein [Nocardiopsaceae bacterium]